MGEYARHNGREIKIGTCEEMYYLRADQAAKVEALDGNVDPADVEQREGLRFRFPFPDEDMIAPGDFDNAFRSLVVHGVNSPEGVEHDNVQFTADGYVMSIPCPEGTHNDRVHRNGFAGAVKIVQQRWVDRKLVTICQCGGCGAKYRLSTLEDAAPVIRACFDRARREPEFAKFWITVGERIMEGYAQPAVDTRGLRIRKAVAQ